MAARNFLRGHEGLTRMSLADGNQPLLTVHRRHCARSSRAGTRRATETRAWTLLVLGGSRCLVHLVLTCKQCFRSRFWSDLGELLR